MNRIRHYLIVNSLIPVLLLLLGLSTSNGRAALFGSYESVSSEQSYLVRASVSSNGEEGNERSPYTYQPDVSSDGRYVVFSSLANNLVENDTNSCYYTDGHCSDIFLHDLFLGETSIVSLASDSSQGNDSSDNPSISSDGRYIAFTSAATNFFEGNTYDRTQLYLRDRLQGTTEIISIGLYGNAGYKGADSPDIAPDGSLVVFSSYSDNLVTGDYNSNCISPTVGHFNCPDIFVRDRNQQVTKRVSISSTGEQGNAWSFHPQISDNGRYVVFDSPASNLVENDTFECPSATHEGNCSDIFIHDLDTEETILISVNADGEPGNGVSWYPSISADGRFIAFESTADNLVENDTNDNCPTVYYGNCSDIFVHDRLVGETILVSVASDGTQANRPSYQPQISADGQFVVFISDANNLVSEDTNNCNYDGYCEDVFLHNLQTGETKRISLTDDGFESNGASYYTTISANGKVVTFVSEADNLVAADTNGVEDVFVYIEPNDPGTYTVSGTLTDRFGDPITGAVVWAGFPSNTISDNNGNFTFSALSAQTYTIRPTKDGYVFSPPFILVNVPPSTAQINFVAFTPEDCALTTDSDADALLDGWEMCGYDGNGDGNMDIDLPRLGANYEHKDIFVEIDYMEVGQNELFSHQPKPEAIETIVESFDNAPIDNPDNTTGIHLHVDYGYNAPLFWGEEEIWGALSQADQIPHSEYIGSCISFDDKADLFLWGLFDDIKQIQFEVTRKTIFHYNIWAHKLCPEMESTSGISRNILINISGGSANFIVSLGAWTDSVGSVDEQAGTFMHELGHNLGLKHGGGDSVNNKPNYLSIMNYLFQMKGLIINTTGKAFDYSGFELPTLDETHLNEPLGIGLPEFANYGTRWYCYLVIVNRLNAETADWNCDRDDLDLNVAANINKDEETSLTGFDDWAHIVFSGGEVGGLGLGEEIPNETEIEELTKEEDDLIPEIEFIFLPLVKR